MTATVALNPATLLRRLVQFDITNPVGTPIPLLVRGVTDARFFSPLGIQTYGILPMSLPKDFKFHETIHAADERIPVDAVEFGASAVLKAMQRFGKSRTLQRV
jgi:acetylornithine deacetylase/succinyl-diaminopimelate desuccinylase-like protein